MTDGRHLCSPKNGTGDLADQVVVERRERKLLCEMLVADAQLGDWNVVRLGHLVSFFVAFSVA